MVFIVLDVNKEQLKARIGEMVITLEMLSSSDFKLQKTNLEIIWNPYRIMSVWRCFICCQKRDETS